MHANSIAACTRGSKAKKAPMSAERSHPDELILGLVSVSDRAARGVYSDQGIPELKDWLARALKSPYRVHERLIADERLQIERTLIDLVDEHRCDLVLTTGGTGPAERDVTPEATRAVATREMPGFGEQMRRISLEFVPTAILSRQVGVLREIPGHAALILNLPGQPKAIAETLEGLKSQEGRTVVHGIFAAVPYCIDLIGGPYIETDDQVVKAFRPKSALRKSR
jgi:molybdopterin adenylyltransferase